LYVYTLNDTSRIRGKVGKRKTLRFFQFRRYQPSERKVEKEKIKVLWNDGVWEWWDSGGGVNIQKAVAVA
jgi:hypothetical protein